MPELGTYENPPGDEWSGSAWMLPEIKQDLAEMAGEQVEFNTCAYQTGKKRWYKKAMWGGKMEGGSEACRTTCR